MHRYDYLLPLTIWAGVLIVCLLTVYVAWRALFADRSRGRRRCPKCWYDMAYSPGMLCAECGHVAKRESEFQRTRRRPGIAALAILICLALVVGVNDQMNQVGFLRHVPTRMLMWTLPIAGGMNAAVGQELGRRAASGQLSKEQWVALIERCAIGGWGARPPSDAWVDQYGGFIDGWRNRFVNDAQLEAPLDKIPPRLRVKTREVWPEGTPIVASVRLDDWWPAGMECRVRATPRLAGGEKGALKPITFYRTGEFRFVPSPFTMYLPPLGAGPHEIAIDFQIERRRMASITQMNSAGAFGNPASASAAGPAALDADASLADLPEAAWEPVGSYSVTLATKVEGTLAGIIRPTSSERLSECMAQVFGNAMKWTGGGRSPVRFTIAWPATFTAEFNDTAVGVSVELLHDGEVTRRLNVWWIAGVNIADTQRNYGYEIDYENLAALQHVNAEDEAWQLRVRSDPLLALRAGVTKQFWKGEFAAPLKGLRISPRTAPPKMWWTEGESLAPPASQPIEQAPPPEGARRGRRSF